MNQHFVFPRPRPARAAANLSSSSPLNLAGSTDSDALRASILEVALELGIGSNPLVTDWMFNNILVEELEEEQEQVPSPGLTHDSPPTSEESVLSPSSSLLHPQNRRDPILNSNGHPFNLNLNQDVNNLNPLLLSQQGDAIAVGLGDVYSEYFHVNEAVSNVSARNNFQTTSFNDGSIASSDINPPRTPSVGKLRKNRPAKDGYESDGGYLREKKANKKEKSRDGVDLKSQEKNKKNGFIQAINKMSNDVHPSPTNGYESDGDAALSSSKSKKGQSKKSTKSKSKNPSKEIGYETDGGDRLDKKSKTRFFKLSTKSSKGDLHIASSGSVPALPNFLEKTVVPLPIAGRFATTLSSSTPSLTTKGGESYLDSSFLGFAFQPSPVHSDFTSTTTSPLSSVPPGVSTFDQPVAPTSGSPSAFNNANGTSTSTHLDPKNRDSDLSATSYSSSGSGSNQQHHNKSRQNRKGLFPPPSAMKGHHQQQELGWLRTASSLSSLKDPKSAISLPATRTTSPAPADLPSSPHSVSASTSSVSLATSFPSSFQFNKPLRVQVHREPPPTQQQQQQNAPFHSVVSPVSGPGSSSHVLLRPTVAPLQIPSKPKVRPKNPPTDGFGPRTPLTSGSTTSSPNPSSIAGRGFLPAPTFLSTNSGLSPYYNNNNNIPQGSSNRSSDLTIIPSSAYIVPSPQHSPLKTHAPEVVVPPPTPVSAAGAGYHHHDHHIIPPQPNPAPRAPLPIPPSSSGSESPVVGTTSIGGSAARLRQRMSQTNMRQPEYRIGGREAFSHPVVSSSSAVATTRSVSVGGGRNKTDVRLHQYPDSYASGIGPSAAAAADDDGQSWVDVNAGLDTSKKREVEAEKESEEEDQELEDDDEPDEFSEILDRFENCDDEDGDIPHHYLSLGGQALERTQSFKAGGNFIRKEEKRRYPDEDSSSSFHHHHHHAEEPRQYPSKVPATAAIVSDFDSGLEDDGETVGDRTSRWSGSVYSRHSSILDENESEERRDRFVRGVEAMLDAERRSNTTMITSSRAAYNDNNDNIPPIPPLPTKIPRPHPYANTMHKPIWEYRQ